MKKQIILLASSVFILASCGSNNTDNKGQSQAQADSIAKATIAQHDAANAAKNDSTVKALEKEKEEALAKEKQAEKKKEEAKEKHAKPAPAPAPPPPPAKTAQDNKFDSRDPGNQSKPALTPDQQKAQDDKFNRRGGK